MKSLTKLLLSTAVIGLMFSVSANAKSMGDEVVPTKHNKALTLAQIADIQPGLGTVMIEYGHRFYLAYYAAQAANWGLAEYQIKEQTEIQEVGEITRPGHAEQLKNFEHTYLDPIMAAIKAKDWNKFSNAYAEAVDGCNSCHVATGHGFIRYTLPSSAPVSLPNMMK